MTATTITPRPSRRRRGTELLLLILAVAIVLGAYANVTLAVDGKLPADLLVNGLALAVLLLIAHLAVRRFAPYADPVLLPVVALLNGIGVVMIHRLELAGDRRPDDVAPGVLAGDALAQLVWTAIGIVLFVIVLIIVRDHRILQRYTYTAMVVGIGLLLLPLVPGLGVEINGARIWIRAAGMSFQPGEVAKIVLMIFFAGYLVATRDVLALASRRFAGVDLPRGRDLGPIILVWVASLGILVFERDLGTSVLFFGSFVMLLYVATQRRSWLIIGGFLMVGGAYAAYQVFGHVRTRIDIWLDPFADSAGRGYQLVQGLYSLADGGLLGTGLGQGRPDTVPYAKTDFIVTAVGEELGLAGLMAILLLYGILVARGMRAALGSRDAFGKLFAAGLSFILALQVFVVVGGVTRLIPLTGLTTPFLSYGGSSLVANWALVALLLRVSDAGRRPAPGMATPGTSQPEAAQPARDDAPTQVVRR
jgi:cell division protein FtsW (lipid II flippase)